MLCQIPGCKNKGIKATIKNGVFLGVHLENIMIWTCEQHSDEEINEKLESVGEEEVSGLQQINPFLEIQKICKTA